MSIRYTVLNFYKRIFKKSIKTNDVYKVQFFIYNLKNRILIDFCTLQFENHFLLV